MATDQNGNATVYGYDKADRLVTILDALEGKTSYSYDKAGNLVKMTEPGEAVYQYVYDKLNRLAKKPTLWGRRRSIPTIKTAV